MIKQGIMMMRSTTKVMITITEKIKINNIVRMTPRKIHNSNMTVMVTTCQ
jgi:hypothetical protein